MNPSLWGLKQSKTSLIEITQTPILPEIAINKVRKDTYGCIVAFVGMVRDLSHGKRVLFLEYETSAEELARTELQRIADEIRAKWQVGHVVIHHRLGKLKVGEITSVFAIAAPHRREAFEACQYAIDRFKEAVPMWEREITEDAEASQR
ncbi:MAG: molybdenum cofactor biosynthesis protein MoaE [Chloroflexi bacterium]|nr:molybdenum cofactor biosynthesis protein MoaE [Chloroflexota bacterium]